MGIKEWFIPQISEHWPIKIVEFPIIKLIWLIRPGIESLLIFNLGIVQEWITSLEVVRIWIGRLIGKIK